MVPAKDFASEGEAGVEKVVGSQISSRADNDDIEL
jgi:hypothetical protein